MNISERILKTITEISEKTGKDEDSVTWNEIAVELADTLNNTVQMEFLTVNFIESYQMFKQRNKMNIEKFKIDLEEFMKKQGYPQVHTFGVNYETSSVDINITFCKGLNDL